MSKLNLVIFGDISSLSSAAALQYRNHVMLEYLVRHYNVTKLFCFSIDRTGELPKDLEIFLFGRSVLSKINTIINKIAPILFGSKIYNLYLSRFVQELLFDLFCTMNANLDAETIIVDIKSINYFLQSRAIKNGAKYVAVSGVCHPVSEHNEIRKYCCQNGLTEHSPYMNKMRTLLNAKFIKNASRIVLVHPTKFGLQTYTDQGVSDEKITVPSTPCALHHSFARDFTNSTLSTDKLIFLCFTGGTHKKGIHHLLATWTSVDPSDAELRVVGNSSNYVDVSSTESIKWLPYTTSVQDYYRAAHVFVCPSLIDLGPRSVYEAMAAGLLIIVSDRCGAAEFVDHSFGYVYRAYSQKELRRVIRRCLTRRSELETISRNAVKAAGEFSEVTYCRSIFKNILDA